MPKKCSFKVKKISTRLINGNIIDGYKVTAKDSYQKLTWKTLSKKEAYKFGRHFCK